MSRYSWQNHSRKNGADCFELKENNMNLINVFSKIVEAYSQNELVTVVTDFESTVVLLKSVLSLPDTNIVSVDIADVSWNNYYGAYLLSLDNNGFIYCQPAIDGNGKIHRGGGLYLIDEEAIGSNRPEAFVFEDEDARIEMI